MLKKIITKLAVRFVKKLVTVTDREDAESVNLYFSLERWQKQHDKNKAKNNN